MSGSLRARGVGVSHGAVTVLQGIDLAVGPGDRVAVLGPNGVGKTTLLRVLAGELAPETGAVVRHPASASVVHVPQEPGVRPGETLSGYLARRTGVAAAQAGLDEATAALTAGDRGADDRYAAALESWLALGGADLAERTEAVAGRLAVPTAWSGEPDRGAAALSGGQSARLRLAAVLLVRADILLLDEPTNDLDSDGLAALEDLVAGYPGGLVVVSHDREFLARTATRVLELDEFSRGATAYGGGWETYLAERAAARARAEQDYEEYATTRDTLVERARRQKEWPAPAPAGPATRSASRTSTSATGRCSARSAPARRARRPSGSWPGWRWWSSRGTRGSYG